MIVDIHVHIGKTEKTQYYYTFDSYKKLMIENDVSFAVVFPNLSNEIKSSVLNSKFMSDFNEFCMYPFLVIDPNDLTTLDQMDEYEIYGVKFHPSMTRVTADDCKMDVFWEKCKIKNIPALIHSGRDPISSIEYIIGAAKKFNSVNFIGAHLGGNATDIVERALDILKKERLDNIYLDTSASKFPDLIRKAVEAIGPDKILFGSDVPYADLRIGKICIDLADIKDKYKEAIFYENARIFFPNMS
jgi:predicted TIM-barrel fold metal-dependent hydrolase